jgi:MFS family permease
VTAAGLVSPAVLTRPLLACYAMTAAIHVATAMLSTLLPFHLVDLGGSRTQIGLLFSVMTVVSMVLRPAVGGWVDRLGPRPVIVPGIAVLVAMALALQLTTTPQAVIAVMVGAGLANALISMTASVIAARSTDDAHRGEALSMYYLHTSLSIAIGPPLALWLRGQGGMSAGFAMVSVLAAAMLALVFSFPQGPTAPAAPATSRFRPISVHAVPLSCALVLTTIGHTSIYAFLPLYALSRGQDESIVWWFFTVYSVWLIVCRAVLGRFADRYGRARVALPSMLTLAVGYFALALPPTAATLIGAALSMGTANAVLYPTLAALVLDRAPAAERGLALGTLSASWDLGVVVGSALVGFVADHVSFGAGFGVGGVATLLGAATFVVMERRRVRFAPAGVA